MNASALHIAVIGAGPAGSVAAIRLAQLGHQVTLYEKAKFPRDKVCGECLSATGIGVLERLGIKSAMRLALEPAILRKAITVAADGSASEVALPTPMWGLTRVTMDEYLLRCAIDAGVIPRMQTAAAMDDVNGDGVGTSLSLAVKSQVGNLCHVAADVVIVADGRGQSLSRAEPTGDFGIKAHFRDVDGASDTIELVALDGGAYAGLAPVNGNLWNAAWSVPASVLKQHGGDVESLFSEAVARSPHLGQRFARATRVSDWLACPLPRHAVRRDWPRNVIPVGNAAAALEPVGGEGMGLAMRSGELAAEAIHAAALEKGDVDSLRLRKSFDRLWNTRSLACRGAAVALSHATIGPLAVGISNRVPLLARVGLSLMGK